MDTAVQTAADKTDAETRPRDWSALLWATVIFAGLSLWAGMVSPGFLEADACTHYQYARWCFAEPSYLVNVWGRPVCTGLYAVPALLAGRTGTKIISLLVALAIAATTYRIARLQKYRWPALAFIFLLAEPLVFLHSFSELTELPFALLMAVAFLAYREKRWWELALVAGVMPLSRPEGFGFIILAGLALLLHRKFHWLLLLPIPLLIWNFGGWLDYGQSGAWWKWLIHNWPYAAESLYKPGSIFHFLILLPVVTGPFIFPFMWIGVAKSGWKFAHFFSADHETRCDILIAAIPLAILLGHSILYCLGKMASNGEMRYMLIVAPFWALLGARGWTWIFQRFSWRSPIMFAGVAALLPIFANVIYPVIPLRFDLNWQEAKNIAEWYEQTPIHEEYPKLLCAHPGIAYFLDISPADPDHMVPWKKQSITKNQQGVLLVWDDIYSLYNSNADLSVSRGEIARAGWILLRVDVDGYGHHWAIYLSPRDINGNKTASNL